MTDYECLETGVAAQAQPDSNTVHGVALGSNDQTNGASGKTTKWPPEVLEEAAEKFEGVPIVKDHPNIEKTENGLKITGQAPIDSKVGEIKQAKYKPDVGVLWEGEITDEEMLQKVEDGIAEVSPVLQRELEQVDEDTYEATSIKAVRDLGLVSRGASPSNSIETGAAAMTAEALAEAFAQGSDDTGGNSGADTQSDEGTNETSSPSSVAANSEETMTEELTDNEKAILEAAEGVDEPTEALNEYAATEQATIVAQSEYDSLSENVEEVRGVLSEALSEKTELKDSTIEALGFEALCDEFRDDEGSLQVEALRQVPESGEPESEESEGGVEALSEDADVEKAEALYNDMQSFDVDHEDTIVEALGVEDFDTAQEVLD